MKTERQMLLEAVDRMGWPEIHAFNAELGKGQGIYEYAGGYMMRCIKTLFGIKPREEVLTYKRAMKALIDEAQKQ